MNGMIGKILIIDDEADVRSVLSETLESADYEVKAAASVQEAHQVMSLWQPNIILCDLFFGDNTDGMTLLPYIQTLSPRPIVIIMSGYGNIELAVTTMKEGADDFLTKPINQPELVARVERYLQLQQIRQEVNDLRIQNLRLQSEIEERHSFSNIIGQSPLILRVFDLIRKVVDSDKTVLILGESGTGKELVAKAIHWNSPRRNQSFIVQNCAAIPRELLESELFGHVRGSFTGATRDKPGLFEQADLGSFFLDEIGDLDGSLQAKILRVVEDGVIRRIGDNKGRKVNVRLICATSQDLEQKIRMGSFRNDLYYRLNVITIKLPPLRDRRDDIPLLIHHFLSRQEKTTGRRIRGFSSEAMGVLESYPWPGNVRELENAIEQATLFADDGQILTLDHLPTVLKQTAQTMIPITSPSLPLFEAMEGLERTMIMNTLEQTEGNKTLTARLLGINRTYLYDRLEKYGFIDLPSKCQIS
jgi:DNA-binding NtrC family response regulator